MDREEVVDNRLRRYYRLTPTGSETLAAEAARLQANAAAALSRLGVGEAGGGRGVTESAGLERGYRRLLACYPRAYRRDHADEILGVLMAGAGEDQRRPRLAESADLFWSALKMRLRGRAPTSENRPWADALALFSLAAPVFLLPVDVLAVALPYRVRLATWVPFFARLRRHPEIGGLRLLGVHIFGSRSAARSSSRFSCSWGCGGPRWPC